MPRPSKAELARRKRRCRDGRHCGCKDELRELHRVTKDAAKLLARLDSENNRLKQALSMRAILFGDD